MITIDATEAIAVLNGMAARIAEPGPVLAAIGYAEVEAIRARIEEGKTTPDGNEWAPWRPWTRESREAKGNAGQGLLWDTGTLLNSIRYQTDARGVVIGTDVGYADELQHGRGGPYPMAARPFVGWDKAGAEHAEMLMVHHIRGFA